MPNPPPYVGSTDYEKHKSRQANHGSRACSGGTSKTGITECYLPPSVYPYVDRDAVRTSVCDAEIFKAKGRQRSRSYATNLSASDEKVS